MRNIFHTPFTAVFTNEVILNTKRVAPYALMVLFAANAVLWWGWGPAVERGWATNSDFYIRRNFGGFSFILGLPIFTAIIMGDPVIRDFRLGVDSIIFSKPVHRASYLLGKFFGNFFVLVCCQSAFAITLFLLQWVPFSGMVTLPVRVTPYFKHFFIGVVITHLVLAAVYFAAGTLTRNAKVVYGLAVCFYPVFIGYQFLLRELPPVFRVLLDPVGFNSGSRFDPWSQSADFLNQYVVHYGLSAYANRASMIIISALVLLLVYLRFAIESPNKRSEHFTKLPLSEIPDRIAYSGPSYGLVDLRAVDKSEPRPAIGTLAVVRFERVRKFAAIAYNEVLLNSKRVAPCVMALLCAGNGLLWWGWGPATGRGWAVNSDAFIAFALPAYSFMMLPLLTAVFMADPVIRDFRAEINPLIFSKPVSRAEYLLGKFFGSFFVLACGQSAFVVMWFVLQAVPKQGVVTHGFRVIPYFKHFLVFVVITHLTFAAVSFTVGTLTRNAKIGYGLGVLFYPLIAAYNIVLLNSLPMQWRAMLDPLLMRWDKMEHSSSAEYVNHHIVVYDADLMVNRAAMILIAAICLAILYVRFSTSERSGPSEKLSVLNLSTAVERVYYPERSLPIAVDESERTDFRTDRMLTSAAVPEVVRVNEGIRANANKLITALGVEFRLLYAERSLVVIMPLSIFFSILEVAFYNILPHVSQSAAYATNTAKLLLLFLIGIAVFYTGEAMHRDREVKIEPVVWATPVPNSVLLLSKCLATLALTFSLIAAVGLIAIFVQLVRGHTPVDLSAYVKVYGIVLVPGTIFITAFVVAMNIVLRNKYLTYVVAVGTGAGLFYLYSIGYKHWLYNPLLYQLWNYQDLTSGRILGYRLYWLALAALCLAVAHIFFERKSR